MQSIGNIQKHIPYQAGLDIGSTTAKMVVIGPDGSIVFSDYRRHRARIHHTIKQFFQSLAEHESNLPLHLKLTGSAGLGVSQRVDLPFVQEVIATHTYTRKSYPTVRTAMDIGGEDAKIIFLNPGKPPDIRMNGSCAGGTGSFIDQMASLLNISPARLNELAADFDHIYPIASRCGVFAKTDVQNMFSRNISHRDIAASIFHAVAIQCINSLARGKKIKPRVLLCGGVFSFLPQLVKMFTRVLNLSDDDMILPENSELIPAMGAAFYDRHPASIVTPEEIIKLLDRQPADAMDIKERVAPLFSSSGQFEQWKRTADIVTIRTGSIQTYEGDTCFLGIDSGSTTTKILVTGENDEVLFSWYRNNQGNPIGSVVNGLMALRDEIVRFHPDLKIVQSAVTGYGEDLIKAAFNIDSGIVETIAHFTAARFVDPDVSFILDIGGQDMKAIFIENGVINRIELNEACSSGCGSFLETLASSLDYDIGEFSLSACRAEHPCDLGTRCTVFMNSKIKQSLRENAPVSDISAGLAYSVVKNCLFKVLKLHDMSQMGDHIVLQGGTFKNPAIVRAVELLTGKKVQYASMPEMMGAFGSALYARAKSLEDPASLSSMTSLPDLEQVEQYQTRQLHCKGCENNCRITRFEFSNHQRFYSGNKCEKYYANQGERARTGFNFSQFKNELMFNQELGEPKDPVLTIGIPRCLNMYQNFIFWNTLFFHCNIRVKLSSPSTIQISEKEMGTVMSDNICFPAKLVHGHIHDLGLKEVDRIFYPMVIFEKDEFETAMNSYNCPIVSSYPDVIASAMDPENTLNIPFDRPVVNFRDIDLLKKMCIKYLKAFSIPVKQITTAFTQALKAQEDYQTHQEQKAADIIGQSEKNNSLLMVLAGRPYHIDSLINHKIPEILTKLGADIITEDAVPRNRHALNHTMVVTQWAYPNRMYHAAEWVKDQGDNIQMIQLNSFGCGPDAVVIDEVKEILKSGGKNHTLIKVDEISSPGSVKLRLRSMIASLKLLDRNKTKEPAGYTRPPFVKFETKDRNRTIWAPFFSEDYSSIMPPAFKRSGYDFEILPKPDRQSVDLGLQFASNDICYPGTIVIGDIVKALTTRKYDPGKIAIGITQTGGQCRASNYLALIKKAVTNAGFGDIPIISVAASQGLTPQPGFKINWLWQIRYFLMVILFADCLAKMYYAVSPRETIKGRAQQLRQYYFQRFQTPVTAKNYTQMFRLLERAIDDFNQVPVQKKELPKMGIVGEIYAKYNYFANQDLVHWLMSRGIEPVLPPLVDYFIQDLVNYKVNIKAGIRHKKWTDLLGPPIEWLITHYHHKINRMFSRFKYAVGFDDITQVAQDAGSILTLTNQFGEGWLIPGEIAAFAKQGVNNVISLQPFGCIANHIISKGVETRIRQLYPDMNLYFLDFDPGMSEVNVRNRLHFMIENLS